ncbi:hypothetical protein ACQ3G6_11695 [Allorhizobium undicola]|uniref:hypothetical protein n=1 Tax=Allorhizobium undicola TaxID=78527 RepID=UPI003D338037
MNAIDAFFVKGYSLKIFGKSIYKKSNTARYISTVSYSICLNNVYEASKLQDNRAIEFGRREWKNKKA